MSNLDAEAEADYDPWAEPEPAPAIRPEAAREYIDRLVASWRGREAAEPEPEPDPYADHAAPMAEQMLNGPWPDPEPEPEAEI